MVGLAIALEVVRPTFDGGDRHLCVARVDGVVETPPVWRALASAAAARAA
jgi:hypothetical protein